MDKVIITLLIVFTFLISCVSTKTNVDNPNDAVTLIDSSHSIGYANTIKALELKESLYKFASNEMQGRETGEEGQKKAAQFLIDAYKTIGIPSAKGINYLQKIPKAYFKGKSNNDSENVIAFLEGTTKPNEIVVLSAHYDHIGMKDGEVFNGADDDGSGNMALLEIAEAFAKAKKEGKGPKRSILFLHVTGEEKGLFGSRYYTENPIYPLVDTVVDLNIDMIGRVDAKHTNSPNYLYLIGSDKLSTDLHEISELVNQKYTQLNFDYQYNKNNDPNRFYYRSDHYNFAKNNIPVIFYFNGTHQDYHKVTDTPDKINYDLLESRTKLIFYTTWELANRNKRIRLN